MNLKLQDIASELQEFVSGRLSAGGLRRRLNRLAEKLEDAAQAETTTDFSDAAVYGADDPRMDAGPQGRRDPGRLSRKRAAAITTLELLDLLLTPSFPRLSGDSLRKVCSTLEERLWQEDLAVARRCVPNILRELGHLRLYPVGNPLAGRDRAYDSPPNYDDHWIDVGLLRSLQAAPNGQDIHLEETVALIPYSVFTAEFFYGDLPDVLDEELGTQRDGSGFGLPALWRDDEFYYHPENDFAIPLRERYPQLRDETPSFQYFVGTTGLAEIVLDVPRIGRRALRFAAQLFCLRNGVRRATLDGRLVAGTPRPGPK